MATRRSSARLVTNNVFLSRLKTGLTGKQALGRAVIDESVEIAKLSDDLAGFVDDDDLVRLVGRHPEIVVNCRSQARPRR